jgi:hypothetical protein
MNDILLCNYKKHYLHLYVLSYIRYKKNNIKTLNHGVYTADWRKGT